MKLKVWKYIHTYIHKLYMCVKEVESENLPYKIWRGVNLEGGQVGFWKGRQLKQTIVRRNLGTRSLGSGVWEYDAVLIGHIHNFPPHRDRGNKIKCIFEINKLKSWYYVGLILIILFVN